MLLVCRNELMPAVVLNLDEKGSMIFWRLIILSGQNDCKFNYMLTVCLGSFLCIALHICLISNVMMVHVS